MTTDIAIVFGILAVAFGLFAFEALSVDIVAVLVVLALVATGLLDVADAFSGFGHPAVIGVGALFVLSDGLLKTGALGLVANRLEQWSNGSESRLKLFVLSIVAISSGFLNNTPVVAMFIPVVVGLSLKLGFRPSRFLIPLSYAAILGGTCTLIGTSTNLVVAGIVETKIADGATGVRAPTMFDFTPLGILVTLVGLGYLLTIGRRFVPDRETISSMTAGAGHRHREYVTELEIRPGGELVGVPFAESLVSEAEGVRTIQIIRGEQILWPPFHRVVLRANDAIVIAGNIQEILELSADDSVHSLDEIVGRNELDVSSKETELAEILVLPNSPYVGRTLDEAQIRLHFDVNVIAIQRQGMHLRQKISEHPLRTGDLLLVQGTDEDLHALASEDGVVLMGDVEDVIVRRDKAGVAALILVGVIGSLSTGVLPLPAIALGGATAMVLSGCLSAGRVYQAVNWRVLILIAGMLALGKALNDTGAAALVAEGLVAGLEFGGPRVVLIAVLVLTTVLTEAVSNTAVAAIMVPIALEVARGLGVDGTPFIMAVAYGASCSFLTPVGYQTNTLVYGAGGYKFSDFARVGAPLVVMIWTLCSIMIPVLFPF